MSVDISNGLVQGWHEKLFVFSIMKLSLYRTLILEYRKDLRTIGYVLDMPLRPKLLGEQGLQDQVSKVVTWS
jgi:hypothetical protein